MALRFRVHQIICCCPTCCTSKILFKKKKVQHEFCGCKNPGGQKNVPDNVDVEGEAGPLLQNEIGAARGRALELEDISAEDTMGIINEPAMPFSHRLPSEGLRPSSNIIVQGVLTKKATSFALNLLLGDGNYVDIAFHFNPRLDQLYSARNSRLNGHWGDEEGNSQQKFPFRREEPFYLEVFLTHEEFMVAVNGIHYCSFKYRTYLRGITNIEVVGDVKLSLVHISPSTISYPSSLPPESPPCLYQLDLAPNATTKPLTNVTPFYGLLQSPLRNNSQIIVTGKVKLLPYSFYINLQADRNIWPHPEIPLHISVRFSQEGRHVILANAWINNSWGREEISHTKCLFDPGQEFRLQITCIEDTFVAKVDDQPLLVFKHRYQMPFNIIDTLHIQGDVFIHEINVQS